MSISIQPQQNNFKPNFGMRVNVDFNRETTTLLKRLGVDVLNLEKTNGDYLTLGDRVIPGISKVKAQNGNEIDTIVRASKSGDRLDIIGFSIPKEGQGQKSITQRARLQVQKAPLGELVILQKIKSRFQKITNHECSSFEDILKLLKSVIDGTHKIDKPVPPSVVETQPYPYFKNIIK